MAAEEAKRYLQKKEIPLLFESLMTGLMVNKPDDPLSFLEKALHHMKQEPSQKITWDMFIDNPPDYVSATDQRSSQLQPISLQNGLATKNPEACRKTPPPQAVNSKPANGEKKTRTGSSGRVSSAVASAKKAVVPNVPVIVFIGGPGGAKTTYATRAAEQFSAEGLVHINVPQLLKEAIKKYENRHEEWTEAKQKFEAGELLAAELVLAVLKIKMSKFPNVKAFFLEGFPGEVTQAQDFEKEVKAITAALILDYHESELRKHMAERGVEASVVDKKLTNFRTKTLPAAKYFDDSFRLHLIGGEQPDEEIMNGLKENIANVLNGTETDKQSPPNLIGLPNNDVPVILVAGAPGSEKSTFSKRIADKYDGFVHVSMGNLLKAAMEGATNNKMKIARDRVKKGDFAPAAVCRSLMYQAIHDYPSSWGYVIEGFPRTVDQAKDFELRVMTGGQFMFCADMIGKTDLVLLIDCSEEFCMKNLRSRVDENGKPLDQKFIEAKLRNFKQHTLPMLKRFDQKQKLTMIEGDNDMEATFLEMVRVIDNALFIPQDNGEGNSLESPPNE